MAIICNYTNFTALNLEYFIAKRIIFDKENRKSLTRSILNISVTAIAISVAAIIISISVVTGFKREITDKATGFEGQIQITDYNSNNSYESSPIFIDSLWIKQIEKIEDIKHIQSFASKPGIIKTKEMIQGIVLKGYDKNYNQQFFDDKIIRGHLPDLTNETITDQVLISKKISDLLILDTNDRFVTYFIQDPPRKRVFKVAGIYETGLEKFDESMIICDIRQIQRLNDWDTDQVGGIEMYTSDFDYLDYHTYEVRRAIGNLFMEDGTKLSVYNIKQKMPGLFDWLGLMDMNTIVIIALVLLVASINMISGLVILILERTNFIGIFKALGAFNACIKKIFMYHAAYLIIKGILIGNIIGTAICLLQDKFHIIKLDQSAYYLTHVPINFQPLHLLFINTGALAVIYIILYIPAVLIANISPVKAIKFN